MARTKAKKAVEPEAVEHEAVEPEAVESDLVLKKDHIHRGQHFKAGTSLSKLSGLHAGNIAFLRRVGTI
jgi:hypothetical protein